MPAFRDYRRWAFESAAADLALRQAGRSLADVLGREPQPIDFVVSLRLGEPPSVEPVTRRLAAYPGLRFKLDCYARAGTTTLLAALAATGAVESIDFKGAYKGTPVDVDTDPELYRRCAEAFPDAWLEDPDLTRPGGRRGAAPASRPDHLGRADPRRRRHRGAAPSSPRRSTSSRRASGPGAKLLRHVRVVRRARHRATTAAASPSWASGAARSSTSRRSSTPASRTTSRPSGYDWAEFPESGLPAIPLPPDLEPTGFRRRS